MAEPSAGFMERVQYKSARIGVIGLGYVGLPLAVEFARSGFRVTGLDVDSDRVIAVNSGRSYIGDVNAEDVSALLEEKLLEATSDYDVLRDMDVIFICVPTPFTETRSPDLSFIVAAAEGIQTRLRRGQLVVLQSTTHPGTTEEEVLPILEQSGLTAGEDFHLAFSPERINPGDRQFSVQNTPKVVGGITPICSELTKALFSQITPEVHVVSSPRAAEMSKLLENIYRCVNIALVNELALLSERMGIDIWEVIEAASTKPFGFMPFYPGPGVGGHCIPVDPYYLSWKAREYDFYTKFIELAAEVNQDMPYHVVEQVSLGLNRQGKCLQGSQVLVLGVAFKRDVDDARNSPAHRIIELLVEHGAKVIYHDPYIPEFRVGRDVFHKEDLLLKSVPLTEEVMRESDCTLIVAGHTSYDYDDVVANSGLVVDTVNATRDVAGSDDRVIKLGRPLQADVK
jgi:UDP-N-acetyl-D-glucosamine dehydrogenase